MTVQITLNEIKEMVKTAAKTLLEGKILSRRPYSEPACRLPYWVRLFFAYHAIDREYQRDISSKDVADMVQRVSGEVLQDFKDRKITEKDYFKIINRDTCVVSVLALEPTNDGRRVYSFTVVTCYVWDGRLNIENGHYYFVNEPSIDYEEIKKWNEENQDKVMGYADWKHNMYTSDIRKQRKDADTAHYWRNNPPTPSHEKIMNRLDLSYKNKDWIEKHSPENKLPDEDRKAIDYYMKNMGKKKIKMEPI